MVDGASIGDAAKAPTVGRTECTSLRGGVEIIRRDADTRERVIAAGGSIGVFGTCSDLLVPFAEMVWRTIFTDA